MSDVRKHWKKEIRFGRIELIRELNKLPDMETVNETKRILDAVLRAGAKSWHIYKIEL